MSALHHVRTWLHRPKTLTVSETANGSSVTLSVGDFLAVSLAANPTAGYGWQVALSNASVLALTGPPSFGEAKAPDPQAIGAGVENIFKFRALRAGATEIELIYRRSFDPPTVPPAKAFVATVIVR